MLSGETAKGSYPIQSGAFILNTKSRLGRAKYSDETVLMMAETCLLAEYAICYAPLYDELKAIQPRPTETVETIALAAVAAANEQDASAILVLSTSGETARLISKYRPRVPILTGKLSLMPRLLYLISSYFNSSNPKRADIAPNTLAPWVLSLLVLRAQGHPRPPMAKGCG